MAGESGGRRESMGGEGGAALMALIASVDNFHAYEELATTTDNLPSDVNPAHREMFLDDAKFTQLFHMSKLDFASLPKWKQSKLKKELRLF
jgi:hypothetical protein